MPLAEQDLEEYLKELEDFDATREEKVEFLESTYAIMECFVDIAFEMDPVTYALAEKARDNEEVASDSSNLKKCIRSFIEREKQQAAEEE